MLVHHNNYAILVISSDRYADLWTPFFECFVKRWPNCPYKVYLGSNQLQFQNAYGVETILSGPDKDWSTSLKSILNQISERHLLVILEDFFVISDVDTAVIQRHFEYMETHQINHMHNLYDSIPCDQRIDEMYGLYEKGAPYRVNVYGFWNKECLSKLLIEGESPWNFEIMGSYRSSYLDNFYSMIKPPFQIMNMVEKGKYFQSAVQYARDNHIKLSFENREILNSKTNILSRAKMMIFILINKVSWRLRLRVMNFFRKILSCY